MSPKKTNMVMRILGITTMIGASMVIIAEVMGWTSAEAYDPNYSDLAFGFTMLCSAALSWSYVKRNDMPSPPEA